jgi:hypothetical protein
MISDRESYEQTQGGKLRHRNCQNSLLFPVRATRRGRRIKLFARAQMTFPIGL